MPVALFAKSSRGRCALLCVFTDAPANSLYVRGYFVGNAVVVVGSGTRVPGKTKRKDQEYVRPCRLSCTSTIRLGPVFFLFQNVIF